MTTSWNKTLIFGRVAAEILTEKANQAATELLSELGKLDAERREAMREFINEVNTRANTVQSNMAHSNPTQSNTAQSSNSPSESDLQATIDDLRAEIAATRNELQRYRNAQP
jgi:polyhydroxyalkanoate synthesis regulator phasin